MEHFPISWNNISQIPSRSYICGYCGENIASNLGFLGESHNYKPPKIFFIYICHVCKSPTFFDDDYKQTPGSLFGKIVNDIPSKEVEELYNESRRCMSTESYTASVLYSRKLLMNIAVSKGAMEGLNFKEYVDFLSDKGFIPPDGKEWVDHIRNKGNEATHQIAIMKKGGIRLFNG